MIDELESLLPDEVLTLPQAECRVCGCTEEEACPGGCIWANSAATLCSQCAVRGEDDR